ncbi:MAG: MoaD/ThiS family protein [Proteobacteria bacterium]|nr:MoaD/ThiS family protein [Pseudomonadota bacterium]
MELTVKLYGTLSGPFDNYDHREGLGVCLAEGSSIGDLLIFLNLNSKGIGMVFMDGRPVKKETRLKEGARVKIFQPIFGG